MLLNNMNFTYKIVGVFYKIYSDSTFFPTFLLIFIDSFSIELFVLHADFGIERLLNYGLSIKWQQQQMPRIQSR